jgi:hypothetical protein
MLVEAKIDSGKESVTPEIESIADSALDLWRVVAPERNPNEELAHCFLPFVYNQEGIQPENLFQLQFINLIGRYWHIPKLDQFWASLWVNPKLVSGSSLKSDDLSFRLGIFSPPPPQTPYAEYDLVLDIEEKPKKHNRFSWFTDPYRLYIFGEGEQIYHKNGIHEQLVGIDKGSGKADWSPLVNSEHPWILDYNINNIEWRKRFVVEGLQLLTNIALTDSVDERAQFDSEVFEYFTKKQR